MRDPASDFTADVVRLTRTARIDLVVRRCTRGLFFGLLPGLGIALLAGSVTLPVAAPILAAAAAAAGLAAGALTGLLKPLDPKRLLIHADSVLGSRELASTAYELATLANRGAFARAVLEDASQLLRRTPPRTILGRLKLTPAPYVAVAALLTAGLLLFPVNLGQLFAVSQSKDKEIARIAEELREGGERLAQMQQGQGRDRSIELSRQLAQLGSDLLARKVTPEEALDRMSQLESGLQQEYELRMERLQPAPSVTPGPGAGSPGGSADGSTGGAKGQGKAGSGSLNEDSTAKDLADALGKLRRAQRDLSDQGYRREGQDQGQNTEPQRAQPQSPQSQAEQAPEPQNRGQQGTGLGQGGNDSGSESAEGPSESDNSGIGTLPAPQKRGPPSSIVQGDKGPSLQAQGNTGPGDSTRLLARALPEWTGSHLPEDSVLNQYSRRAESALARDEVPLKLRQSVKEYFTSIGITK